MKIQKILIPLFVSLFLVSAVQAQESKSKIKQVAAQFVKGADVQDGKVGKDFGTLIFTIRDDRREVEYLFRQRLRSNGQ